jgi:membrane protease YdiL (CAAX protease family)
MKDKKRKYWRILRTLAIILCLLIFTPLVIPKGTYKPELFGVPYSLWTSFLITVLLVVLTYFGKKVHRTDEEEVES